MWWTFISNKNKLDKEEELKIPLLEVDINSEFAFLTFSVAGTALTVSTHKLLVFRSSSESYLRPDICYI